MDYTYDDAGRVSSANTKATSYSYGAGVSAMTYAPHGGLTSETYDNDLIHAVTYNTRLQANEIKLGTSGSPTSLLDLTYSYGSTTNFQ